MAIEISPILFLLVLLAAQQVVDAGPDFSCSANSSLSKCETYIAYLAKPPKFLDLGSISDLFGVSRLSIAQASNLASEDEKLLPDQLVLIPVTCGCSGDSYFANVTYEIKTGDSYYLVSAGAFENLTNWHVMEEMNRELNPNLLQVGTKVTVPLFCKCPTSNHLEQGIEYLITYVWESGDQVLTVAAKFGAELSDLMEENNDQTFEKLVGNPVLVPVSKLPGLSQPIHVKPKGGGPSHKVKHIIVIVSALGGGLFILLVVSVLVYVYRPREKKVELSKSNTTSMEHSMPYIMNLGCKGSCSMETTDSIQSRDLKKDGVVMEPRKVVQDKLLPSVSEYLSKPIVYENQEIMEATLNLDPSFRIGGLVYRGKINGEIFAIKKTKDGTTDELNMLQRLNHTNLVKLIGVSSHMEGDRFLVYEYAENGSLDKWLYRKNSSSSSSVLTTFLTWSQRLQIALDVAKGLQYLHEHTQPSILHGDLRSCNILLDSRFQAKLSNFSKAKPAFHTVDLKVDIFSFGVILMELLSGRKALGRKENGELATAWKDVKDIMEEEEKREERLRSWIDPIMEGFYPIEGALSLASLARACTVDKSTARPTMAEVVFNLCVLAQTCLGSGRQLERSWTSRMEAEEEVIEVINPIIAR